MKAFNQTEAESLIARVRSLRLKSPSQILFRRGGLADVGAVAKEIAEPGGVFLVVGGRSATASCAAERARDALALHGFTITQSMPVTEEPQVGRVDEGAALAREHRPMLVVAVGGGSVIDCAKAVAALATNEGSVEDYLEGVGRGFSVHHDPLPMIAVPTTSGTGAEMTRNAVIADRAKGFKKSMRDERMIPTAALLDPDLTKTVPRDVTAASGMDAITQLIEPCISVKRQPGPTAVAHQALEYVREALPLCCREPNHSGARAAMALASGMSGVCLANAGLALAHGIASGLGGLHRVAHGLICGILLPHTLRFNRDACEPELAEALRHFLNEDAVKHDTIDRGIAALDRLIEETGVPPDLTFLNLTDKQVGEVASHSMGSSMTGNPVPMDEAPTYEFLRPLM